MTGGLSRRQLVLRYSGFAVLATLVNLGLQRLVLLAGEGPVLFVLAMAVGTVAGLLVKYVLDRHWIFADRAPERLRQFSRYSLTGLATTALFWAFESLFWLVGQTHGARETGAVLGLGLGYWLKYQLDRRYVFGQGAACS